MYVETSNRNVYDSYFKKLADSIFHVFTFTQGYRRNHRRAKRKERNLELRSFLRVLQTTQSVYIYIVQLGTTTVYCSLYSIESGTYSFVRIGTHPRTHLRLLLEVP